MENENTHAMLPTDKALRSLRRDGQGTRLAILEAAGELFAEHGYAETTARDICLQAGANSAAVNYYFGGKESLYEAVVVEAHKRLVSLEDLSAIVDAPVSGEEKLRRVLARLLRLAAVAEDSESAAKSWGMRVLLRELVAPSRLFVEKVMPVAILPKLAMLRGLFRELAGVPAGSAEEQRVTALVMLPCLSMLLLPARLRSIVLPATVTEPEALLEDMVRYAMAGIAALRGAGGRPTV